MVEEPEGHLRQVLLTTCKDRITRLLKEMAESNGETILLQTAEKNSLSPARKDRIKPLDSSALKPRKLEFANSPSKQFSLLEESDKNMVPTESGRFSLALHACMTPKGAEVSCITETEEDCCDEQDERSQEVLAFEIA